jgi:zinc protease
VRRGARFAAPRAAFVFLLLLAMPLAQLPAKSRAGQVKSLPNGLRYVVVEDHASPVVSLQIYVRCGAVNEDDRRAGVSHFLEHMIFKGTDRLTAGQIARVVESRGGSINAATSAEMTYYYIDMPSDSFETAFDVLADSVLRPSFPPEEFEKERKVILEEINDNPQSDLWDAFLETVYRATPYRRQVIGTVETITAMTRDVMVRQHKDYYVAPNMVVVVVGDVKAARVKKRIEETFGPLPATQAPAPPPLKEPAPEAAELRRIARPAQQAHVALGFPGPTLDDPSQVAMDLLAAALGGGNSSPLFQILREQKRSVWGVGASFVTHAGSGAFGVFAECPPENAAALPAEVRAILAEAAERGFPKGAVERAKTAMRSQWLFSQETYHGQASQWGFYTILGRPELAAGYVKELDKVKEADLVALLKRYFRGDELSGVILLPKTNGAAPAR